MLDIRVPIMWIQGNNYLVGTQKVKMEFKNNCLLVNLNKGVESFAEFMKNNEEEMKKNLIIYMLNSGDPLDQVMENLINDKIMFRKLGSVGTKSAQKFARRSSFSATRRSTFSEFETRGRRPATPVRTTRDLKRRMFN